MSESPESASGAPHPAANQPGHAEDPSSGAPRPDGETGPTPGTNEPVVAGGSPRGTAGPGGDTLATPGDSAGVTVNSDTSMLGSSEASRPIQSTGEMVPEHARQRAAQGPDPNSAAPGDSALPPE